jgi:three-Cys-motif partner protein
MGAPKTTTWELDPHTRAKHEILRRYLEAWTPILGLAGFPTIAYVDGFAGPGAYSGGEDGSPLIALKAALQHQDKVKGNLLFLFIEKEKDRAERLEQLVGSLGLPAKFRVRVASGKTFEEGFRENLLDFYDKQGKSIPPTFAFLDPFGWTGVPFPLIKEILTNQSCEVLINFMFEEINRFIGHPDQTENFDGLFGTDAWRQMSGIADKRARRDFLHGLYLRQLRSAAGAKYVRSFEMRNDNDVTDYFLFFATNSPKGMAKMKEAMWKVDQSGEFRFSDATNPAQGLLFTPKPDFDVLRRTILTTFSGKEVSVAEIEDFVLAETPYRETHYKKQVLAPLEREGKVVPVRPSAGRKAGTYAEPAMRLRFLP